MLKKYDVEKLLRDYLISYMEKHNLKVKDFAKMLGIQPNDLSETLSGNAPIGKKRLSRFAEKLNISYEIITKKKSTVRENTSEHLSEEEKKLLALFRKIPEKARPNTLLFVETHLEIELKKKVKKKN